MVVVNMPRGRTARAAASKCELGAWANHLIPLILLPLLRGNLYRSLPVVCMETSASMVWLNVFSYDKVESARTRVVER